MSVPGTYWRIILRDWYNARMEVTIVLRNGASFTGQVSGQMWEPGREQELVTLDTEKRHLGATWAGMVKVRHDLDLSEIVAITASRS